MTTPHLHVFAVDGSADIWNPGDDAGVGWVWLTVPRLTIFGRQASEISAWDYGIWRGSQPATAIDIARKAREIQGLDYKTGPAIVLDDTAVRLNAMVELLCHESRVGDSTLHLQPRDLTKRITDDSLRSLHMYVAQPSISAAVRHGLVALRRAKQDAVFAHELWPYPSNGRP